MERGDAIDDLDLSQIRVNTRGTGSEHYPPTILLSLLLYRDATGVFSSRRIEQSTYESVPARRITGESHPDHDTLCALPHINLALINESFKGAHGKGCPVEGAQGRPDYGGGGMGRF